MEALCSRFVPSFKFIVEEIHKGTIGEVISVDVDFGKRIWDQVERVSQKRLGGGTILDLGVYAINLIQQAFDNEPPTKVVAVGALNEDGVDVSVAAALSYSGGRSATLRTHAIVELPCEAMIVGKEGYIKVKLGDSQLTRNLMESAILLVNVKVLSHRAGDTQRSGAQLSLSSSKSRNELWPQSSIDL